MKNLIKLFSLILFVSLFSNNCGFAQEQEENEKLRVFGLGMHIEQFKWIDYTTSYSVVSPVNKIAIVITPSKSFRVDPEFGFNFHNDKEAKLKGNIVTIGLGVFGMKQWNKTNIYYGIRYEHGIIKNEFKTWNDVTFREETQEEKTNRSSFGPAIGVEYLFGKHFSFGGELGIRNVSYKTKNSQYGSFTNFGSDTVEESFFATDTGLLLRFYF